MMQISQFSYDVTDIMSTVAADIMSLNAGSVEIYRMQLDCS